ncbi:MULTISPECIES: hypothetical protein [Kordiimonas]|uniref:hypothetical protein n=1 Tax=Kordiimonas TaxID=288021 RepID=UPI00257EEF8A|nr:hypothetical protein [Kordiimonas sp. UBA4487]
MAALKGNLFYNLINQLQLIVFPIFLNIYLVRILNLEDLGKWYLVNSAAALIQLLITAPHFFLVKHISAGKNNIGQITSSGIFTYLFLLFGATPFYVAYIIAAAPGTEVVAMMVFAHLMFSALSCEFYFQATLKQKFLMIRRGVSRGVLLILLLIFVKEPSDFILFLILTIGIYILDHLVGLWVVAREVSLVRPPKKVLFSTILSIREMLPLNATHNTLPHIVLLISPVFFDFDLVAIVSILVRITNMATTVVTSSVNVIFPFLLSKQGDSLLRLRLGYLTSIVAVGLGGACFLLNETIAVLFLNRELSDEQVLGFGLLCLYILIHSVYNYISFNFFVAALRTIRVTQCNILILFVFFVSVNLVPINIVSFLGLMSASAGMGLLALVFFTRDLQERL